MAVAREVVGAEVAGVVTDSPSGQRGISLLLRLRRGAEMNGRSMEGDRESIGYRDGRAEVWVFERDASLERGGEWGSEGGGGGEGGNGKGGGGDGGVGGHGAGKKGKGRRGIKSRRTLLPLSSITAGKTAASWLPVFRSWPQTPPHGRCLLVSFQS